MQNDTGSGAIPFLMYHEIDVPGRELSRDFKGHVPYVVPHNEIRSQLQFLRGNGWRGLTVTDALAVIGNSGQKVAVTFDDGSETDLYAAALLHDAGLRATFYVIAGWLGRPGYLSPGQMRELHGSGFEIGCHSMNHTHLSNLSYRELEIELAHSKARLQQILGTAIHHFSCPGGFWDRRVARIAKECGYRSVATSRVGCNTHDSDPYRLSRICILRGMRLEDFKSACRGNGLFLKQARERMAAIPKTILGADLYIRLHAAFHSDKGE